MDAGSSIVQSMLPKAQAPFEFSVFLPLLLNFMGVLEKLTIENICRMTCYARKGRCQCLIHQKPFLLLMQQSHSLQYLINFFISIFLFRSNRWTSENVIQLLTSTCRTQGPISVIFEILAGLKSRLLALPRSSRKN